MVGCEIFVNWLVSQRSNQSEKRLKDIRGLDFDYCETGLGFET